MPDVLTVFIYAETYMNTVRTSGKALSGNARLYQIQYHNFTWFTNNKKNHKIIKNSTKVV